MSSNLPRCPAIEFPPWGGHFVAFVVLLLVLLDPLICTLHCVPTPSTASTYATAGLLSAHDSAPDSPDAPPAPSPLLRILAHTHCSFTLAEVVIALVSLRVIGWMAAQAQQIPPHPVLVPILPPP